MSRIVVLGAGAVGGVIAAQLHRAGADVEVIARGAHLDAIRRDGLVRDAVDGRHTARLGAHATVAEAAVSTDDIVVIATKSHQVDPLLDDLLVQAGPDLPVACATNGVWTERLALRRFDHVLGVLVNVPAVHLTPGVVEVYAGAPRGVLDVGRTTPGPDDAVHELVAALTAGEFLSEATPRVMDRKWAKLLGNVGNVCSVLFGADRDRWDDVYRRLRAEAEAVVATAGITPDVAVQQERAGRVARGDIDGRRRPGGSSWQSASRGTGDIETVALNGEISLLGRLHGVPTPVNTAVTVAALRLVRDGTPVGSLDPNDF